MKINIIYGEERFEDLFKDLVDDKINDLILKAKRSCDLRYNDNKYISTIESQVDKDE